MRFNRTIGIFLLFVGMMYCSKYLGMTQTDALLLLALVALMRIAVVLEELVLGLIHEDAGDETPHP